MENNCKTIRDFRHRFIEDSGAPIQLLISPYFDQRLTLFEKEFDTTYNYLSYLVAFGYDDTEERIKSELESYFRLREAIIKDVKESPYFKAFNDDMNVNKAYENFLKNPTNTFVPVSNVNLYTQEQVGHTFITIDMKKANFQALKVYNPDIFKGADTYEEFIGRYTDNEWIKKSKRTRQIIFGQLNPKRTMQWEKFLMLSIGASIENNTCIKEYCELFSMNSDELIYKVTKDCVAAELDAVISDIKKLPLQCEVKVERFRLNSYTFETHEKGYLKYVYTKDKFGGRREYKCADLIYFPQTYKLINGLDINDDDLVFSYDKTETARFMYPLKMVGNAKEKD